VLATAEDFDRVARLLDGNDTNDTHAVSWYDGVKSRAREILAETSVDYTPSDRGTILLVSREVLSRIRTLGLVYRLSGDFIYADRAWRELEAVAAFDDWHPEHFLDVAEMTTAVATGYDWLYDHWDASQRERLREALLDKGLEPGLDAHRGHTDFGWWTDDPYNWNAVCNGGLSVGALALLGEDGVDRGTLERLLSYTSQGILAAFETFGVDGGWPEGSPAPDGQNPSRDVRRLAIELEDVAETRLAVRLVSLTDDPADRPDLRPFEEWTVDYAGSTGAVEKRTSTTTETPATEQRTGPDAGEDDPTGDRGLNSPEDATTAAERPGVGPIGAIGGAGIAAGAGLAARRLRNADGDDDGPGTDRGA